jgi:hypothetical protein
LTTRDAFRNGIELMQRSARLMGAVTPDGLLGDWRELDNKIEAFRLFQWADRELPAHRAPTGQAVSRTRNSEAFHSIWVLEGTGHMAGLSSSLSVRGLLSDRKAANLPETAMIPLHAGMGTAFAEKLFKGLGSNPSPGEIGKTLRRYVDLCGANCRPGWEDACIEPFGLVVRCLYSDLLEEVSKAAGTISPQLRALFWHGVGRGLYFVPGNFLPLPGARKRMMKSVAMEASGLEDRRNVYAGLIWAVTLVNLPDPSIVQALAAICAELKIHDEFTNGLLSALMAWRHMAPEDVRYTRLYTGPQPGHGTALWQEWIAAPVRDALGNIFPGLREQNHIPALYSYRTHEELCQLSAGTRQKPA